MSAGTPPEHVELPITGMPCASCANRIGRPAAHPAMTPRHEVPA